MYKPVEKPLEKISTGIGIALALVPAIGIAIGINTYIYCLRTIDGISQFKEDYIYSPWREMRDRRKNLDSYL